MGNNNHPTFGNGKICYIEIPAIDINSSAEFYGNVFGWSIRNDNHGNPSFDDGVGEVSGTWVIGPKPASEIGIVISIMVLDIEVAITLIRKYGGKIILDFNKDATEKTARFSDPFGNIFGLYQHSS